MFYQNSLITPPRLPALSVARRSYFGMFDACHDLLYAPELPAKTLGQFCYYEMFRSCDSLTKSPKILPAMTLEKSCYGFMFSSCTLLTNTPELPATVTVDTCYVRMFNNCQSLIDVANLPATKRYEVDASGERIGDPVDGLARHCYNYMFATCRALQNAPHIYATKLNCDSNNDNQLQCMFQNCSSLDAIKIDYKGNFEENAFGNWMKGVSSFGTFYYNGNESIITRSANSIPENWIVKTF